MNKNGVVTETVTVSDVVWILAPLTSEETCTKDPIFFSDYHHLKDDPKTFSCPVAKPSSLSGMMGE